MVLDREKVTTAVVALKQVADKLEQKSLVDEGNQVQMQICLKKIPPKEKHMKLKLPHGVTHENMEICLFVKDLEKTERDYEPTVTHFQDLMKEHGISIVTEIIPLKALKTEYKPYEAKRNLSNAYDVFLADARIIRLLPTYLGKHFYGKKKPPVQVNLQAKNLKEEIDAALHTSMCTLSNRGASSMTVVANLEMDKTDVTDNVISSVKQILQAVPGGWENIKQLNLKTPLSTSIPIYLSEGGPQDVTMAKDPKEKDVVEAEEVSTVFGATVKVYPSGDVTLVKEGEDGEAIEEDPKKRSSRKRRSAKKSVAKVEKTPVTKKKKQ